MKQLKKIFNKVSGEKTYGYEGLKKNMELDSQGELILDSSATPVTSYKNRRMLLNQKKIN